MDTAKARSLLKRIEAIKKLRRELRHEDGSPVEDANRRGERMFFYPSFRPDTFKLVIAWLRDAEAALYDAGHDATARRLSRVLKSCARRSLGSVAELQLGDFLAPGHGLSTEDGDTEEFARAWMGFDDLVCLLVEEARTYTGLQRRSKTSREPDWGKKHWTREEFAEWRGVKPETISKEVSKAKKDTGRPPAWYQAIPGKKRGFRVIVAIYRQMMREDRAARPTRWKRSSP